MDRHYPPTGRRLRCALHLADGVDRGGRERWAKWTLTVVEVGLPVLYTLSYGSNT